MTERTSKSGIYTTLIIYIAIAVVFTVVSFAIPFPKIDETVHAWAYVCAIIIMAAECILTIAQFYIYEDKNQKILGIPIVFAGYIALTLQVIATAVFYICNAFIGLPGWIVAVVEVFIFAFFASQVALGFFFKNRNAEYHMRNSNTKFMDEFRARIKGLVSINRNRNLDKELEDLNDVVRGSDPVTNEKTMGSESELLSLVQELDEAIKNGSEDSCRDIIKKIKNTLIERNTLCKAGK